MNLSGSKQESHAASSVWRWIERGTRAAYFTEFARPIYGGQELKWQNDTFPDLFAGMTFLALFRALLPNATEKIQ